MSSRRRASASASAVGLFGLVADHVRKGVLGELAREVRFVADPISVLRGFMGTHAYFPFFRSRRVKAPAPPGSDRSLVA